VPQETTQYPFLKKGCNVDSIKKYSEIYFQQSEKKLREPKGLYKTVVYEQDSLIVIERFPTEVSTSVRGGNIFKILKRNCTVVDVLSYQ
jgi:hypothetical protein